jgi:FkbM family methyltransferase
MKIFYGHGEGNYIDITKDVFQKCLKDDGIYISAGDGERCNIIGYDPYPHILKHIIIEDHFNNKYMYSATKEAIIKFESINQQLTNDKSPKKWWNTIGKFIVDPKERLDTLHKHLNLYHTGWGGFEYEYPEQLMVMKNVNENSKVLEIGGNVGRVSHIIQTILNNSKNHVIMECENDMANKLRSNLSMNGFDDINIETNCLSKAPLYMDGGHGPRPLEDFKETEKPVEVPTISYSEICKKYNINFDILVADCEGSLFYIFKEDPDMLNNLHTVIMENDYYDITHKQTVDALLKIKGFKLVYQEKGVPWASWSCCYEYFYEVWKKE